MRAGYGETWDCADPALAAGATGSAGRKMPIVWRPAVQGMFAKRAQEPDLDLMFQEKQAEGQTLPGEATPVIDPPTGLAHFSFAMSKALACARTFSRSNLLISEISAFV